MTELSHEDVLEILRLIEESSFDFLHFESGTLKLTVGRGGYGQVPPTQTAPEMHNQASRPGPTKPEPTAPEPAAPVDQETKPRERQGEMITAPVAGIFYVAPEPGAAPFVQLGDHVDEETTVGLIEVMKVFNAVNANVRGVISEICVENGDFVEFEQELFMVELDETELQGD